jgi:hypothetical protein
MPAVTVDTSDIDTALAPLKTARDGLADRIGTLAVIAIARIIHLELPDAAYAELAWTSEGDEAFLEPAGAFYDAASTEIPVPHASALETRLQQYCGLLDETNLAAWSALVTEQGEDVRRLNVAAALAVEARPPLPALPAWVALLEAAVRDTGRPVSADEAERLARALGHSTIPEALADVLSAICGLAGFPEPVTAEDGALRGLWAELASAEEAMDGDSHDAEHAAMRNLVDSVEGVLERLGIKKPLQDWEK